MKWEWLRVGRRIEWVTAGLSLLAFLGFGFIGLSSHDLFIEVILGVLGVISSIVLILPVYFFLRSRRNREVSGVPDKRAQTGRKLGRLGLYSLLLILTLVSATFQASRGMVSLAGSVLAVYVWNLGLLVIVIALNELSVWRRNKRYSSQLPR